MGGDSGENTSDDIISIESGNVENSNDSNGEVTNSEVTNSEVTNSGTENGEESKDEITNGEIASAFDEKKVDETVEKTSEVSQKDSTLKSAETDTISEDEVASAFDEEKESTQNIVSDKVENKEYDDVKLNTETKETPQKDAEIDEKLYERPSGYREGVRDQVWENAKDEHGRVRDPVTGRYMSKDQPWDMGHKPGYEFAKHQRSAMERQISRKEFLDEHNNPDHYRPELPSSNRSHKGESKTENYYL